MKFLIVSNEGASNGIAWKLKKEGHEVCQFIKEPLARNSLVTQVTSIKEGLRGGVDVILFDSPGHGKEADDLRTEGYNVIGGGIWNDKLAFDSKFSMKAMDSFGIKTQPSYLFNNIQDAMEFVAQHNKPLSFNGIRTKSQDELLSHMIHMKKHLGFEGKILLQEAIEGVDVSVEVWYAKGKVCPQPTSSFDSHGFMPGDLGATTVSQSSVIFAYPKREPRIVQQSLKKIDLLMERTKYSGPLSIRGVVKAGKFYGLEFTPSIKYSSIYAFIRLLDEKLGDVLFRVASGDNKAIKLKEGFGYSVKCTIPPYPFTHAIAVIHKEVYQRIAHQKVFIEKQDLDTRIFPLDMYNDSKGNLYTGGFNGVVCEATGYGLDLWEAEKEASVAFRKIGVVHKQGRLDGARTAMRKMDDLRRQGYEVPPFVKPEILVFVEESKDEKIASIIVDASVSSASAIQEHN